MTTCHATALRRSATGPAPADSAVPPVVHAVLRSPGQPLDPDVRSALEPSFSRDFSQVRVHVGAEAAASAEAVRANAYTVGHHIAFAAGQYAPDTAAGRSLLAHELTHVVQQPAGPVPTASALTVGATNAPAERQADEVAAGAYGRPTAGLARNAGTLMRQTSGRQPVADPVEAARGAAWMRCQRAAQILAGVGPPGPRGSTSALTAEQVRARGLAQQLFNWPNPNMEQITEVVSSMRNRLLPSVQTVRAPANDPHCGNRDAYVVGHRPPIHLCQRFFTRSSAEQRIRTMIHEAAHLSGIGQPQGETYLPIFDCHTPGEFESADAWAHFVHCLSGQTPDAPEEVRGRRTGAGGGGRR